VMTHSTLHAGQAVGQEGWLHGVVAFAQPFRMPAFFLLPGLFLAQAIDRDWRTYLDRKVIHFAYFYLLWTMIQFAVKAPVFVQEYGPLSTIWLHVQSFVALFGTLSFIYLLPICFVVTKLAHGLRVPAFTVWLAAAALEIAPIATGWTVIDEFAGRFVFFYTGYLFAPRIFALAKHAQALPEVALAGLATWGLVNGFLVFSGFADLAFVSLALGLAGTAAVVALSALIAKSDMVRSLRYCGENAIAIYLAFFLPMAATRMVLLSTGWISDVGTISGVGTFAGVGGALIMFWAVRRTFLSFLFERPQRFWLVPKFTLHPAR
jgi:uncharacterized membrane protein YcfT